MFAPDDTIVAVATAPGRAGIGVVRISGSQATDVARALLARRTIDSRTTVLPCALISTTC